MAWAGILCLVTPAVAEEQGQPDGDASPQQVLRLPPTVITATRSEQSSFDLPAAIDVLEAAQIREGQLQVNLSESLVRVPGVVVQNRQNYAQDLQISSRGFGARAAFGVRGVRLIADGIPATNPDGQGQAATFNLSSAQRIEVLRGPFAPMYGNHSGGVIQIFTRDGPREPEAQASFTLGSYGTWKAGLQAGGQAHSLNYLLDVSRFESDGYRDHSAATRDHLNAKLKYSAAPDSTVTLVVNALDQPDTRDPQGLTRAEAAANPRQASPSALAFNTRKSIRHRQAGLVFDQRAGEDQLHLVGYLGTRSVIQFQSIPTGAQAAATHPGGVIDFDRAFGGFGARWTRKTRLGDAPFNVTAGVDYDRSDEDRRGFQNFAGTRLGVQGALKRDEDDKVAALGAYLQGEWEPGPRWKLMAGVRYSEVKFDSRDRFVTGANPDDSGSARYGAVTPAAGVLFRLTPSVNLYANAGRGFETPTFNELFYRPDGTTGLNFALQASRSESYEVGVKAFPRADTALNLALVRVDTGNEIVVASSSGGRTTFKNAGRTERRGVELSLESEFGRGLGAYLAYTYLDARFAEAFTTCVGAPCTNVTVPTGNRLPGVPRSSLYGELSWRHAPAGFSTALEARWNGKVYVNDANTEFAGSYAVLNWRAGLEQRLGAWRLKEFVRVDNLLDRAYIGSVIVGETSGRFYEPAPGRGYFAGITAEHRF